MERVEESIARYLSQLETADRQGDAVPEARISQLKEKIARLREETERLNAINAEMMKCEDKQVSLTDPDARSMGPSGRAGAIVGYRPAPVYAPDRKRAMIAIPAPVPRNRTCVLQ